jgi:hypothetical protein
MAGATLSIPSRIDWCRQQKMLARAQLELDEWQAEEEGLQDALLNRNHTNQYQHCSPGVFKRYVMGFEDGQALILAAAIGQHFTLSAHRTPA